MEELKYLIFNLNIIKCIIYYMKYLLSIHYDLYFIKFKKKLTISFIIFSNLYKLIFNKDTEHN